MGLAPALVEAQSKREAEQLVRAGNRLLSKPRSKADIEKAAEKYERAIAICEQIGYDAQEVNALSNLGMAYGRIGNYPKVLHAY